MTVHANLSEGTSREHFSCMVPEPNDFRVISIVFVPGLISALKIFSVKKFNTVFGD